MSPRKRVISIFLILVLLVTAPFSIVYADDTGFTPDDVNLVSCRNLFIKYGLNGVQADSTFTLTCTNGSSAGYCSLYSGSINDTTIYHRMFVPTNGSFNRYTGYDTSNRIRVTSDYSYIVFLSNTNFTSANSIAYPQSGYTVDFSRFTNDAQTVATPSGFYLISFKIKANSVPSAGYVWTTIDMPGTSSTIVVPLFLGLESQMSDDIHRLVFGTGQTVEVHDSSVTSALLNLNRTTTDIFTKITNIKSDTGNIYTKTNSIDTKLTTTNSYLNTIANGNTASTSSVNTVDTANQSLSQDFSQLSTIESGYNTDFNNQIQAINFNDQLSGQQGFLTSSSFVINVFNNLILNNPLTILIIIVSIFYVFRRFV